ncbi:MAG: transposase [bacterium]|nr:MAG: transposase [bacterium]
MPPVPRYRFITLPVARLKIEDWRCRYNTFRPHSSLGDLTPTEYAERFCAASQSQKSTLLTGSAFG